MLWAKSADARRDPGGRRVGVSLRRRLAATAGAFLRALALQWFERMRTGAIDRAQLAPAYSAQLSDEAVRAMAQRLEAYEYGAAPLGAEIVRTETRAGQTVAVVKLVFPRGDSASLLIGLDADGKIAGLNLMSMAGD